MLTVVMTAVVSATGAVATAWVRRTARPWPVAAGTPYEIPLGSDDCPVGSDRHPFVDAPGQLVPPHAADVLLCIESTDSRPSPSGLPVPPRQRVLSARTAEFVALLNRLPDRNAVWQRHQRQHSGWWPDAAPPSMGEDCPLESRAYSYAFVLRYRDRPPVPLLVYCNGLAVTSGTRTRMDTAKPHLVDEFLRLVGQTR